MIAEETARCRSHQHEVHSMWQEGGNKSEERNRRIEEESEGKREAETQRTRNAALAPSRRSAKREKDYICARGAYYGLPGAAAYSRNAEDQQIAGMHVRLDDSPLSGRESVSAAKRIGPASLAEGWFASDGAHTLSHVSDSSGLTSDQVVEIGAMVGDLRPHDRKWVRYHRRRRVESTRENDQKPCDHAKASGRLRATQSDQPVRLSESPHPFAIWTIIISIARSENATITVETRRSTTKHVMALIR